MQKRDKSSSSVLGTGWQIGQSQPEPDQIETSAPTVSDVTDPQISADAPETQGEFQQLGAVTVTLLGIFGGIYMLYTWGWYLIAAAYQQINMLQASTAGSVGAALQGVIFWAAPFAPALWFAATLLLAKRNSAKLTAGLVLGLLVMAPLPLFLTGGGA